MRHPMHAPLGLQISVRVIRPQGGTRTFWLKPPQRINEFRTLQMYSIGRRGKGESPNTEHSAGIRFNRRRGRSKTHIDNHIHSTRRRRGAADGTRVRAHALIHREDAGIHRLGAPENGSLTAPLF